MRGTGNRPGVASQETGSLSLSSDRLSSRGTEQSTNTPRSTVTVTVTEEPTGNLKRNAVEARQATSIPTKVPAYASSCDAVKYASACDCWGITAAVSTAPTPTVTVTTTVDYCEVSIIPSS